MQEHSATISYVRIGITFVSWYFALDHPEIFMGLTGAAHLLYVIQ